LNYSYQSPKKQFSKAPESATIAPSGFLLSKSNEKLASKNWMPLKITNEVDECRMREIEQGYVKVKLNVST